MAMDSISTTIVSSLFEREGADIVIRSRPTSQGETESPGTMTVFRVLTSKLSSRSAVFKDMCNISSTEASQASTSSELPEIQLEESGHELSLFLPFFYDDPALYPKLSQITVKELVKLWQIADKYEAHLVAYMAANEAEHRLTRIDVCDGISALRIYVTATKLGETAIAAAALKGTLQAKYTSFPADLVSALPSRAVDTLARLHAESQEERYHQLEKDLGRTDDW